jgi:hypothetical protein
MNANDTIETYGGTESYHRYLLGLVITDGVKELADRFQCYWFLDIVASYQAELKGEEFQSWKLKRDGDGAIVTCDDVYGKILKRQDITYTDFSADEATVWVVDKVMLLPNEY